MASGEWTLVPLSEVAEITTGKLDSNAAVSGGKYPFFTCAPKPLSIDNFAFDCEAVLLAGNNANGIFATNYYKGKFNAYQRTYVITSKNKNRLSVKYLYYQLKLLNELLGQYSIGTATKFLTMRILNPIEIPLPEIEEQLAIAYVLGTLDDKIELNRQMNETLEAMARTLFKSWFVDFDPVRARAEARAPEGMDAETAALFPDSFEDSELGKIPKGWRAGRIGDELETVLGGTPARSNSSYWTTGTIPWINSGKVNEFRITTPTEYITEEAMANSAAKLLPKRTTVLAITGATLGQVSLLEIAACANQSVVGILQSEHVPSEFIYFWVKYRISDLISAQTGGAQQHVNKNDVNNLKFLYPDVEVLNAYKGIVHSFFDAILVNYFENETLTAIRDALLPKLMSGEIRVKP